MTKINGETQVYAVLGRPIRHSLSPALHNAWFNALDLNAIYVAQDVAPSQADHVMTALRTLDFAGVNLTVPLKQRVVSQLDSTDDDVRVLGAANTLVNRDGQWFGYNTDVQGFIRGLRAHVDADLHGRRAVILGAGGAALAVAKGLREAGVDHIDVCNRTESKAIAVCERLASLTTGFSAHALFEASTLAVGADLIVNALSGPGADTADTISPARLAPGAIWCDLNYWMADPPGQRACARARVPYVDGFGMLAHQAALAFEHFTGTSPPEVPIRRPME